MSEISRLTRAEQRVLWAIRWARSQGLPATYRELASKLGNSSPGGVFQLVKQLEGKGFVSRSSGSPRGVQVLLCPSCTEIAEKAAEAEVPVYCVDCCRQVSK